MPDTDNSLPANTGGKLTANIQSHQMHAMATGNGFNRTFLSSATPGGSDIDAYNPNTDAVVCGSDLD